eukprot:scaffold223433_cov41-Attheya_sp.AAC.2
MLRCNDNTNYASCQEVSFLLPYGMCLQTVAEYEGKRAQKKHAMGICSRSCVSAQPRSNNSP